MTENSPTLNLACQLIDRKSVTPDDAGCQTLLIERLQNAGFTVTRLRYGEVDNFWAVHGEGSATLAFAGHTDVVPAGDEAQWQHPPFVAKVVDGDLCGRGAADMKGSLAAMVVAAEQFVTTHPGHLGKLAFLITSAEIKKASSNNSAGMANKNTWPANTEGIKAPINNGAQMINSCVLTSRI